MYWKRYRKGRGRYWKRYRRGIGNLKIGGGGYWIRYQIAGHDMSGYGQNMGSVPLAEVLCHSRGISSSRNVPSPRLEKTVDPSRVVSLS